MSLGRDTESVTCLSDIHGEKAGKSGFGGRGKGLS